MSHHDVIDVIGIEADDAELFLDLHTAQEMSAQDSLESWVHALESTNKELEDLQFKIQRAMTQIVYWQRAVDASHAGAAVTWSRPHAEARLSRWQAVLENASNELPYTLDMLELYMSGVARRQAKIDSEAQDNDS